MSEQKYVNLPGIVCGVLSLVRTEPDSWVFGQVVPIVHEPTIEFAAPMGGGGDTRLR